MNRSIIRKTGVLAFFCFVVMSFALSIPMACYGEEYELEATFSPNIINIASARNGDIRVYTDMSYSSFIANGNSAFIYFNDGSDSIPNIQATRDSLGHLILRFTLEDFLAVEDDFLVDDYNSAAVVLVMDNGDEYIGYDDDVYIVDKVSP